jgi:hypothetical protein
MVWSNSAGLSWRIPARASPTARCHPRTLSVRLVPQREHGCYVVFMEPGGPVGRFVAGLGTLVDLDGAQPCGVLSWGVPPAGRYRASMSGLVSNASAYPLAYALRPIPDPTPLHPSDEATMPIRTKPWSEVTLQDVEDLITREVLEDSTIEYKGQLDLATGDEKREFLKDVTAMANAVGGTIIYGGVEGKGDRRGLLIELKGQVLNRDEVHLQIMNLLRDALDERLDGVLFKALETSVEREYIVVLRIPASPLAPHRLKSGGDQFFARGTVSKAPMNTRQIREMILQRATAMDKALEIVEQRTLKLKSAAAKRRGFLGDGVAPPDQVVLHVIPLFPATLGWTQAPGRQQRLLQVPPFGLDEPYDNPFYAHEGMYSRIHETQHVLFLRGGGLEFQRYDVLSRPQKSDSPPSLQAWRVELDVLAALEHCQELTNDGLLPLPVLVSLRILDVADTLMRRNPGRHELATGEFQTEPDVLLTPYVISNWGEAVQEQARHVFDEMWQAWHLPACRNYYPDGRHFRYAQNGDVIPWQGPGSEA